MSLLASVLSGRVTPQPDRPAHETDQQQTQPQDAFAELARITLTDHSLAGVMDRIAALAKTASG